MGGVVEVLGLFYALPHHVFGTDRWRWSTSPPESQDLITTFPYGLVRHPAAAAFIWLYAVLALTSLNYNAYLLAGQWIIFVVLGTLWEEGGLTVEFAEGEEYLLYREKVNA